MPPRYIHVGRLATNTTMTAQYAAVAENISKFRVWVMHSAPENMAVKITITHSLLSIFSMLYKTAIGMVKVATARSAVRNREIVATRSAE